MGCNKNEKETYRCKFFHGGDIHLCPKMSGQAQKELEEAWNADDAARSSNARISDEEWVLRQDRSNEPDEEFHEEEWARIARLGYNHAEEPRERPDAVEYDPEGFDPEWGEPGRTPIQRRPLWWGKFSRIVPNLQPMPEMRYRIEVKRENKHAKPLANLR